MACIVFLSMSPAQAQEKNKTKKNNSLTEKLHVKLKDGAQPDIYVDGKKFDFSLDLIDTEMIASVFVLKGEKAIKKYNASNGVIVVTTKKKHESDKANGKTNFNGKTPVIIINGNVSNKETLDKLSPDDIEKIEVFKDEKAVKKYKAPNGAIIITTKKEKKK